MCKYMTIPNYGTENSLTENFDVGVMCVCVCRVQKLVSLASRKIKCEFPAAAWTN